MNSTRVSKTGDILAGVVAAALLLSGIAPVDRTTWLLEVFWVFLALGLYFFRFRRSGMTPLLLWLLAVHCLILIAGGYWTYEKVPLGEWMRSAFAFDRNNYDRIGHLAQGFVPAILFREILLRKGVLKRGFLSGAVVLMMCMGFSSFFEILEWRTSVAMGARADAFLATQGDPWDTQEDMFCCMIGAAISLCSLSRLHDSQLVAFEEASAK